MHAIRKLLTVLVTLLKWMEESSYSDTGAVRINGRRLLF